MPLGVLLALAAYGLYSCCDAIIKALGGDVGVHEIAFFTALFSLLPAALTKPKGEHWRYIFRLRHPWLVHMRGLSGMLGNSFVIFAFVSIPLAEAYSLVFLAPIFVVGLSVVFLKEKVGWHRLVYLGASFVGVMLVVRPGFRELELGHISAVGAALCGAVTTTILRKVAPIEQRTSLLGIALGYVVVINGIWMLPTFEMPTLVELALMALIGAIGGTANILMIGATRLAPASEIAPSQYSQIFWAIVFGTVFFHELPDAVGYVGLAIVVGAGILNVISAETRIRIFSRVAQPGTGPATASAEVSPPLDNEPPVPERDAALGDGPVDDRSGA